MVGERESQPETIIILHKAGEVFVACGEKRGGQREWDRLKKI